MNPNTRQQLLSFLDAYLPPLAWASLIFFLSNQSGLISLSTSSLDFAFKKIAHIFVYAVLFFLIDRAMRKKHQKQLGPYRAWMLPILVCLLYAASDEIHQTYVPGRYGTFRDIGYDMLGVFISFMQKYRYI